MDDHNLQGDEALELEEYLAAERELKTARESEETEFNQDLDIEQGEEIEEESGERQDAPVDIMEDAGARRSFWQAQGLVELEQSEFASALARGDDVHLRSAYYRLAVYHGRTLYILRSALNAGKEALAQAAMRNLATLHRAMTQMHKQAAHSVPVALVLDRQGRDDLARDLVVRSLHESAQPLELDRIVQRVNDLDVMGVAKGTVQRHLKDLAASGHAEVVSQRPILYARTQRAYIDMDIDAPSLRALIGAGSVRAHGRGGLCGTE